MCPILDKTKSHINWGGFAYFVTHKFLTEGCLDFRGLGKGVPLYMHVSYLDNVHKT